jgi:hypothetical protein
VAPQLPQKRLESGFSALAFFAAHFAPNTYVVLFEKFIPSEEQQALSLPSISSRIKLITANKLVLGHIFRQLQRPGLVRASARLTIVENTRRPCNPN